MAYFFGDALTELKKIKGKPDGHLDFSTLPEFAKVKREVIVEPAVEAKDGEKAKPAVIEIQDERDLGAMISLLTVAVQQLDDKLNKLGGK